jgi:8-oxo-dGTP pyrophosphatase MutT (NUDIX family)
LLAPTGRVLLLRRSAYVTQPFLWSVPAGGIDEDESPVEAAVREVMEETGYLGPYDLRGVTEQRWFTAAAFEVLEEFVPRLNWENDGWAWVGPDDELPEPTYPRLEDLLDLVW